jgi:hypothetical protein
VTRVMVPKFEFVPAAAIVGTCALFSVRSPALSVVAVPHSCEENFEEEESTCSDDMLYISRRAKAAKPSWKFR